MKLKKTILGLAVVAVAGVNAWLANDASAKNSVLSLLNLENVAEAAECEREVYQHLNYYGYQYCGYVYKCCKGDTDKPCSIDGWSKGTDLDGNSYTCSGNYEENEGW